MEEKNQLSQDKSGISRRRFLKIAAPAVVGYAVDRTLFGGAFTDVLWGFISNPKVRDKVLDKLQNLDEAFKELQQQIADRKWNEDKIELGQMRNESEEWMNLFPNIEVFDLKGEHKGRTIFFADIPSVTIQVAPFEKQKNLTLYSDPENFLSKNSIVLPGFQIGTRMLMNVYAPSFFTSVNVDGRIVEFGDYKDGTSNPRDGAVIVGVGGRPRFVSRNEVDKFYVSGSKYLDPQKTNVQGIFTVPTSVEIDLSLSPEKFFQQSALQLEKIDKNTLFSQNITRSKRFETFYVQMDDRLFLMGICKTQNSLDWPSDQRLSIYQALNLSIEYGLRNKAKKVVLIPTDPDLNDAVLRVDEGKDWKKSSITNQGQSENLLRQPFYLTYTK